MFRKILCCLIGHDHKLRKLPSDPRMWCDRCGKDFTEAVEKEMELIEKEYEERKQIFSGLSGYAKGLNPKNIKTAVKEICQLKN